MATACALCHQHAHGCPPVSASNSLTLAPSSTTTLPHSTMKDPDVQLTQQNTNMISQEEQHQSQQPNIHCNFMIDVHVWCALRPRRAAVSLHGHLPMQHALTPKCCRMECYLYGRRLRRFQWGAGCHQFQAGEKVVQGFPRLRLRVCHGNPLVHSVPRLLQHNHAPLSAPP